ncbi:hypothetical protein [Szabonella alba]|nr:hypothetical protein [Szabonella alba]
MIRPELRDALYRRREVAALGALSLPGFWLVWLGGYLLLPLGLLLIAASVTLAWLAERRLRFVQSSAAPGMVEVIEGQIGYFGPAFGGLIAVADLTELRLVSAGSRRLWRLTGAEGETLLIPVGAGGEAALYDVLAGLPGMDTGRLLAAAEGLSAAPGSGNLPRLQAVDSRVIWRRPARAVLT